MSQIRTWGVTVDVSLQNADVLIPILQDQLITECARQIKNAGGSPTNDKPSIRVETAFVQDDETGNVYEIRRVSVAMRYLESKVAGAK